MGRRAGRDLLRGGAQGQSPAARSRDRAGKHGSAFQKAPAGLKMEAMESVKRAAVKQEKPLEREKGGNGEG